MTWTHQLTDDYRAVTTGQTSWTLTAGTVGDLRVIRFQTVSPTITVSSLSGGGVTNWQRAGIARTSTASASGLGSNSTIEIWYGMVTSTGTALTIAYSATIGTTSCRQERTDFRSDSGFAYWVQVEGTNFTDTTATVTTMTWPTVTSGSNPAAQQLAFGYAYCNTSNSAGATSGYTYTDDANGNETVYNGTVGTSSAQAPTGPMTSGPGYSAILAIFSNNPANWINTIMSDARSVATGQTAWTLQAGTPGDLRVLEFLTEAAINVSTLSGGGVSNWQRAGSVNTVSAATGITGATAEVEMWYGVVTSTGTALTITYSGTIGTTTVASNHSDFRSMRGGRNFTVAGSSFSQTNNTTTASPLQWGSITSTRANQLVVGNADTSAGGLTPGDQVNYQYYLDTGGAFFHQFRLNCGAAQAEATTETYSGTQGWTAAQAVFDDGFTNAVNLNQAVKRSNTY